MAKVGKEHNKRFDKILRQLLKLKETGVWEELPVSKNGDTIDEINACLNEMVVKMEANVNTIKSDKKRLNDMSAVLLQYAVLDFSNKIQLSDTADEIDAIAAGLNVLGEELEFSLSTQKKYSNDLENANKLLTESNSKIQTVFNNAPDAILVADLNFKIIEWNRAAERIYGYSRTEVLGRSAEEIINSKHILPYTREKAIEQLKDQGFWHGELYQQTARTNQMIILSSTCFLRDEGGKPVGYLAMNRNVTEMKRKERELQESEKRYHLLVNEVVDYAIMMLDINGIILSWNKGAEKIKGYTEKEVLGRHFSIFYTEEDKLNDLPQKELEAAKKEKKHAYEGWRVKKDKSLFWADGVITELVDEEGNIKGFVKITRDLSERRKAAEEITKMTEELRRSNVELEQFAYVASHDLQEPLRMITSYVQLLERHYKDKLDKDANEFINYAVDGASRMQSLIYSLLEYSRINRIKPFEDINLDYVLNDVMKDLRVTVKETNAKVIWNDLPKIFGDQVLIGQLFFNLIANAIKFRSERPPEITISCRKYNDYYLFSVKDNGIGIKKEYREKIFVIFQRLHSKDKYPGTGIGLAICKKIVERHEGKIWVESTPDEGSTFYFTISAKLKKVAPYTNTMIELKNG